MKKLFFILFFIFYFNNVFGQNVQMGMKSGLSLAYIIVPSYVVGVGGSMFEFQLEYGNRDFEFGKEEDLGTIKEVEGFYRNYGAQLKIAPWENWFTFNLKYHKRRLNGRVIVEIQDKVNTDIPGDYTLSYLDSVAYVGYYGIGTRFVLWDFLMLQIDFNRGVLFGEAIDARIYSTDEDYSVISEVESEAAKKDLVLFAEQFNEVVSAGNEYFIITLGVNF